MDKNIINGNILLYSCNTSELINDVRKSLKINPKYSCYDEEYKYYNNSFNSKYYEYIFTKIIKNDLINMLISKLKQYKRNILTEKKYIIFHNFHFVNSKYYKQFQSLFEYLHDSVVFIFTSNKQNIFLQAFLITQHVRYEEKIHDKEFKTLIKNDCEKIINDIYKSYETIDFCSIRKKLYDMMFAYQDTTLILNCLSEVAIKQKQDQSQIIIKYASTVDNLKIKGNKDIIYLEHFILLLINNDNI